MPEITQSTQLIYYTGPTQPLATAPFAANLRFVARENLVGGGLSSWRPDSSFPPFNALEDGRSYVVYSLPAALPYMIPTQDTRPNQVEFVLADAANGFQI